MILEEVRARLAAAIADQSRLESQIAFLTPRAEMDRMLERIQFTPNDFAGSNSKLQEALGVVQGLESEISELTLAVDFLQWVAAKRELAPHHIRVAELQAVLDQKSAAVTEYEARCEEMAQTRLRYAGLTLADPKIPAEDTLEIERHRELQAEMRDAAAALRGMHAAQKLEMRLRGKLHPIFAESSAA